MQSDLSLEVVPDITKLDAFDHVFEKYGQEIKVVSHTTSYHGKDVLLPANNGTKSILETIKKQSVKRAERVVATSSYATVVSANQDYKKGRILNEDTWNPVTCEESASGSRAYFGPKKFAEMAVWEFWNVNKDIIKFKMTAINPVFVFGPQIFDEKF